MTWSTSHAQSESAAAEALLFTREGRHDDAVMRYRDAAIAEELALRDLDHTKQRTLGITIVSAAALWFKGQEYARAERLAHQWLSSERLPEFARGELKELLQEIWSDVARGRSGIHFVEGDVVFGVRGGQVVYGGAPLDLVVDKVDGVRALYHRTAEMLAGQPLRRRGLPHTDIQQLCRPWVFQVPPGSYQFAIRIQEPEQTSLFPDAMPRVAEVASTFLRIMRATANGAPEHSIPEVVPDRGYQDAFLKLARNLAPTGERFSELEIRHAVGPSASSVVLLPGNRDALNGAIRRSRAPATKRQQRPTRRLEGTLRGLHLDRDWLELAGIGSERSSVRVYKLQETLDDVVGPMVNRLVAVEAIERSPGRFEFVDIELVE